jgi:hypothetical protein
VMITIDVYMVGLGPSIQGSGSVITFTQRLDVVLAGKCDSSGLLWSRWQRARVSGT